MSTGRHAFKHNDCARLIRAVEAAGKTIRSITLNNGSVTVAIEAAQPAIDNTTANPWDEVLKDGADKDQVRSRIR